MNWESLPEGYRQGSLRVWERFHLLPHTGMGAILYKKELAALFVYVAAHEYLRDGGRLGFLITQTLFKSEAARGFREFRLPDRTPLGILVVHDLVALKPFEAASNRTALLVLAKGLNTEYPVRYCEWVKRGTRPAAEASSLAEVHELVGLRHLHAKPMLPEEANSPWLTGTHETLTVLPRVIGCSAYRAVAGFYSGGANGVYWVKPLMSTPTGHVMIRNLATVGRIHVEEVTQAIEPDFLYPLLRGRDVRRWSGVPSVVALIPQDPVKRLGYDEEQMKAKWPKTYSYLDGFRKVLAARRCRPLRFLLDRGPFYTVIDIAERTFAPWKLVWRDMGNRLAAAVVSDTVHDVLGTRTVVPEHHVMMVPLKQMQEAHYLCAMLNASPSDLVVRCYTVSTQMSTHVLEHVRIPKFDPKDPVHQRLAELSLACHEATARGDSETVRAHEAEIDRLAAQLWGITDDELAAIQAALADMTGGATEPADEDDGE